MDTISMILAEYRYCRKMGLMPTKADQRYNKWAKREAVRRDRREIRQQLKRRVSYYA